MIKLTDVTVLREGKKILNDIQWEIRENEHWFVMGPNGSGKTTLLELLLGYNWASQGSVEAWGNVYGKTYLPDIRQQIGYVAPWVEEHIRYHKTVKSLIPTEDFLDLLEIKDLSSRRFYYLSSGEKLKVMIAIALMSHPKVLILDEPFSALDMGARYQINQILKTIVEKKQIENLILVTHHLEDISEIMTHGLFLKAGKIVKQGSKESVLTKETLAETFNIKMKVL